MNNIMTYKEEKIMEEFEKFNREELFCHFDDMGESRAVKAINWWLAKIDSLEAKHQKEIEGIKYKAFFEGYDLGVEKQMLRKYLEEKELEEVKVSPKEKIKNG